MTSEDPRLIELELMASHEEAVGDLYRVYARVFSEYEDFWGTLVREETDHAEWIRKFSKNVESGMIGFRAGRFNVGAVQSSIHFLKGCATEAENGLVGIDKALSIAYKLENTLIEKEWLDSFETDDDEMKRLLALLHAGTYDHRERIAAEMKRRMDQ